MSMYRSPFANWQHCANLQHVLMIMAISLTEITKVLSRHQLPKSNKTMSTSSSRELMSS